MNEYLEIEKYGYFENESYIVSLAGVLEIRTDLKVGNTFPFIIVLKYTKDRDITLKFRDVGEMRLVYRDIVSILKAPKLVLS